MKNIVGPFYVSVTLLSIINGYINNSDISKILTVVCTLILLAVIMATAVIKKSLKKLSLENFVQNFYSEEVVSYTSKLKIFILFPLTALFLGSVRETCVAGVFHIISGFLMYRVLDIIEKAHILLLALNKNRG